MLYGRLLVKGRVPNRCHRPVEVANSIAHSNAIKTGPVYVYIIDTRHLLKRIPKQVPNTPRKDYLQRRKIKRRSLDEPRNALEY